MHTLIFIPLLLLCSWASSIGAVESEINPYDAIWGFHCHMDVEEADLPMALVIQENFIKYLVSENIQPTRRDVYRPGYGPHVKHQWEIRLEDRNPLVLEQMGIAFTWLALNHQQLTALVHPLTHNEQILDLETEGEDHDFRALWMGDKPQPLNTQFFYNPPIDEETGSIKDTRTPTLMSDAEIEELKIKGDVLNLSFVNPRDVLANGFHIHMNYVPEDRELALKVYRTFVDFLKRNHIPYSYAGTHGQNFGPHQNAGWAVEFETQDTDVIKRIGIAVGWLMCNRANLPFFVHPQTNHYEDAFEQDHSAHLIWMGIYPDLL